MNHSDISFDEAQKTVDAWISQFEEGYFPPLVQLSRLVEELGELSRALSHQLGVKKPKSGEQLSSVQDELGDLLYTLICFANAQNISLADALSHSLSKFSARDEFRWTRKSSASSSSSDNKDCSND